MALTTVRPRKVMVMMTVTEVIAVDGSDDGDDDIFDAQRW